MTPITYARLHYPSSIVQHAVWLYLRFTLSLRDVEAALSQEIFKVAQAEVQAQIKPDDVLDDRRRIVQASI